MTTPTIDQFRARYPEFSGVADALVTAVLAEAALEISDLWPETKAPVAMMLLAAHMLAAEGGANRKATASAGPVTSRKVGDVKTSYGAAASSSAASSEAETAYGRRLAQMRSDTFAGQFRAI